MPGNLLLIGGAMASAAAPGGVSSAPGGMEQYPVPSPEFAHCAELATDHGPDEAIGMRTSVVQSFSGDKVAYRMRSHWEGPIFTDEGIACGGIVNYRGSIELRSGKYAQKIDDSTYTLKSKAQAPAVVGTVRGRGSATAEEMCVLAKELQGETAPIVRLVRSEERTYKKAGNSPVTARNSVPLATLSCDSDSSGGVGPDRGNGSGGVSTK